MAENCANTCGMCQDEEEEEEEDEEEEDSSCVDKSEHAASCGELYEAGYCGKGIKMSLFKFFYNSH